MKAVFASIALFAAGALAQLTINTPSVPILEYTLTCPHRVSR